MAVEFAGTMNAINRGLESVLAPKRADMVEDREAALADVDVPGAKAIRCYRMEDWHARFLVAQSELPAEHKARRRRIGRSSGEAYEAPVATGGNRKLLRLRRLSHDPIRPVLSLVLS